MTYATAADLITRFGEEELIQLSDRLGAGVMDATVIGQALADAGAVIDGHLASRYRLPIAPVPAILTGYACDLARERLYRDAVPEIVAKRGDDARKFLGLVAQGKVGLGLIPEPVGNDPIQFTGGQKVFAREAI